MRFNACELKQLATSSSAVCDKEGILSLREKEGKLWNKTDVLTERWCRLIGNLFFYMKGKTKTSEPSGVIVLEKYTVRSEEQYSFVIESEGGDQSTYFLASNPSEATEWIKALQSASYASLKKRFLDLSKQVKELQAQMTNSIADDVVLELSFRCTQLNYFESFCGPSTVLDVQYTQHESDFPTPHSRTEVIHGTANPVYRTAVRFTSNEEIGSSTKLGFVVYRVTRTKTEAEKMEILGSCFCFVGDLIQLQHELTLHLQNNGDFTGCLHLSLVRQKIAAIEPKKNKSGRVAKYYEEICIVSSTDCEES